MMQVPPERRLVAVTWILAIGAIPVAIYGLSQLSEATAGVGIIGLACLIAVIARIAQAEVHRR